MPHSKKSAIVLGRLLHLRSTTLKVRTRAFRGRSKSRDFFSRGTFLGSFASRERDSVALENRHSAFAFVAALCPRPDRGSNLRRRLCGGGHDCRSVNHAARTRSARRLRQAAYVRCASLAVSATGWSCLLPCLLAKTFGIPPQAKISGLNNKPTTGVRLGREPIQSIALFGDSTF
jgi:hypothetical protein